MPFKRVALNQYAAEICGLISFGFCWAICESHQRAASSDEMIRMEASRLDAFMIARGACKRL